MPEGRPWQGTLPSSSQLLKGGPGHLGGFADSSRGVGIFPVSLRKGPFCSGFLGLYGSLSPGKEVYS